VRANDGRDLGCNEFSSESQQLVILRSLRCLLFAVEVLDVKRLVTRLLLSPSTMKPQRPYDPKLQCSVRHQGPENTPIEIPHLRFFLV